MAKGDLKHAKGAFYHRAVEIIPCLWNYVENQFKVTVEFSINSNQVIYDQLHALSELLGTTKIFIAGAPDYGYYDEVSCELEVRVEGVKFEKE